MFFKTQYNHCTIMDSILDSNASHLSTSNSIFSTLFDAFELFPSMYIDVGKAEILQNDSRQTLKRLKKPM